MALAQRKSPDLDPLAEIEILIRDGDTERARRDLSALSPRDFDRAEWASFARLSWRCGAAILGARLLYPIVRGTSRRVLLTPTAAERAEYAMCLAKLGAHHEAIDLLRNLSPADYRRAELYFGLALVGTWDYPESIVHLKEFLKREENSEYDRCVARLNLAAALVFQKQYWQSDAILRRLLHDCAFHGWKLLWGNSLEVYGMSYVWRRNWSRGKALLEQAQKLLRDTDHFDELLVRKGLAAITLLRSPGSKLADEKAKEL